MNCSREKKNFWLPMMPLSSLTSLNIFLVMMRKLGVHQSSPEVFSWSSSADRPSSPITLWWSSIIEGCLVGLRVFTEAIPVLLDRTADFCSGSRDFSSLFGRTNTFSNSGWSLSDGLNNLWPGIIGGSGDTAEIAVAVGVSVSAASSSAVLESSSFQLWAQMWGE